MQKCDCTLKVKTPSSSSCGFFGNKMPQFTNLRLLLFSSATIFLSPLRPSSSSSSSLLFKPKPRIITIRTPQVTHKSPSTNFTSSYFSHKKQRNQSKPFSPTRRNKSSLKESSDKINNNRLLPMEEETESVVGFNRKRAEGRDKNDGPKNLQLKVRKLNPVNTISYVQVTSPLLSSLTYFN